MASTQELETRLVGLEDRLNFIMDHLPVKVAHPLMPGTLQSMPWSELYKMVKGLNVELVEGPQAPEQPAPSLIEVTDAN